MTIEVRPARRSDAAELARMAAAMHAFHGDPGGLTAEIIEADGFGERAWFTALIAERNGEAAGYALFHPSYDSGHAARGLYLCDLWVEPAHRRVRAGEALLEAVAKAGAAQGAVFIWLAVQPWNAEALAFYQSLGAAGETVEARAIMIDTLLSRRKA